MTFADIGRNLDHMTAPKLPNRERLKNHLATRHGLSLAESELEAIEEICREGWLPLEELNQRMRNLQRKNSLLWETLRKANQERPSRRASGPAGPRFQRAAGPRSPGSGRKGDRP